jgi:hypothetical protein
VSDGKTDTPETDAARAGCYFGCNLERERDSYHAAYDGAAEACRAFKRERDLALRRVKELEAKIDVVSADVESVMQAFSVFRWVCDKRKLPYEETPIAIAKAIKARIEELEGMVARLVELVAECGECPPNTGICTKTITCDDCIRDWAKGEPK